MGFPVFSREKCREIWLSNRVASKPLGATDWNGSGMHVNFSDGRMRDEGGEARYESNLQELLARMSRSISTFTAPTMIKG